MDDGVFFRVKLTGVADAVCVILCEQKSDRIFQLARSWARSVAYYSDSIEDDTSANKEVKHEERVYPATKRLKVERELKGICLQELTLQIAKVSEQILGIGLGTNKTSVARAAYLAAACGINMKQHLLAVLDTQLVQMRNQIEDVPIVPGTLQPFLETSQKEQPSKSRSRSPRGRGGKNCLNSHPTQSMQE